VLEVAGEDRVAFLQGLVTNDVAKVSSERAIFAALLTAQGRYLFDFFIFALGEALCLETEAARIDDLKRRLGTYKLRSKVSLADASARFVVAAGFGGQAGETLGLTAMGAAKPFAGGIAYADPRLLELGLRFAVPRGQGFAALDSAGCMRVEEARYDRHRLALGVPDGSRDLPVEKAILLENGFDELNGIDWDKGCYMGQELTARTRYRGLVRKRLMPVAIEGPVPEFGAPLLLGDKEAGEMRSASGDMGLALVRLEALGQGALTSGASRLTPAKPDWAKF
jgi:hypothetical protein